MRYSIITLGCKVNAYESEYYSEQLRQRGHERDDENFDVCIINTCTVTNTAAAKSRQMIHRARKKQPQARIVVVGCFAQTAGDEEKEALGADLIIGAQGKAKLPELAERLWLDETCDLTSLEESTGFESMPIHTFEGRKRAFVKIQDGCNQFCTYCAIPFARGRERCLNGDQAVAMVRELEQAGMEEIVLTGIHTGRYAWEGHDLAWLIGQMLEATERVCFRISSIEITEVSDALLALMKENRRVLPHLHIPIQSGSDGVLQRMGRPYTVAQFSQRMDEIRAMVPDISVSTDVMCGFVGETEEEFAQMLDTLKRLRFSFLHVFPYSERKGTKASRMGHPVHGAVARQRTEALLKLSAQLRQQDMARFDHGTVLVERGSQGTYTGYTEQYHPVTIHSETPVSGRVSGRLVVVDGGYEMEV